jgi:hypothetical protein
MVTKVGRKAGSIDQTRAFRSQKTQVLAFLLKGRLELKLKRSVTNHEVETALSNQQPKELIGTDQDLFKARPGTLFGTWLKGSPTDDQKLIEVIKLGRRSGLLKPRGKEVPWVEALDPEPGLPQKWVAARGQSFKVRTALLKLQEAAKNLRETLLACPQIRIGHDPNEIEALLHAISEDFDENGLPLRPENFEEMSDLNIDVLIRQLRLTTIQVQTEAEEPLPPSPLFRMPSTTQQKDAQAQVFENELSELLKTVSQEYTLKIVPKKGR